jgi:hypothetical protein
MPGAVPWGLPSDGPPPAIADTFGGVRIDVSGDLGGTVFGHESCGNFLEFQGCEYGGGAGFWAGLAGTNDPTVAGGPGDVVVEEGADAPLMALGLGVQPYPLAGHQWALESDPCEAEPVDLGIGAVLSRCGDGSLSYMWLETGRDPVPGEDPGWGFRTEMTILPGNGISVLGLASPGSQLPPEALDQMQAEVRAMPKEAGHETNGEGGFDFSGGPLGD